MRNAVRIGLVVISALALWSFFVLTLTHTTHASVQYMPLATETETPTPTPTPRCRHTAVLSLELSNPAPDLGEPITVTATLTNTGYCSVGLPQYTLRVAPADWEGAAIASTNPVLHYLGMGHSASDQAQFVLVPLNPISLTVTADASFEVHIDYPGPAFWGSVDAEPITMTVAAAPVDKRVLAHAAYAAGCYSSEYSRSSLTVTAEQFSCAVAAGHAVGAQLQAYSDAASARAAFTGAAMGQPLSPFAGCRVAFSQTNTGPGPIISHSRTWLGGHWVVTGTTQDDTNICCGIDGAQPVHDALVRLARLSPCRTVYLPVVTSR